MLITVLGDGMESDGINDDNEEISCEFVAFCMSWFNGLDFDSDGNELMVIDWS
jgi:hypothetical protein